MCMWVNECASRFFISRGCLLWRSAKKKDTNANMFCAYFSVLSVNLYDIMLIVPNIHFTQLRKNNFIVISG